MDEKKLGSILFINIVSAFASATVVIAVTVRIFGDWAMEYSGLFRLGSEGLAFETIVQIFVLSVAFGILLTLFTSEIFFNKVRLLWRVAILVFLSYVMCTAFVVIFRWIPINSWEAWASYLVGFTIFYGMGTALMVIETVREDKRYEKLLSDYKKKEAGND